MSTFNKPQGTNIFGGNNTTNQPNNIFGATQNQGTQNMFNNQTQGTGIFNNTNQQNNQQQGTSIFNSNQAGQQQQGNIFSNQNTGGSIFGQNQQQNQQKTGIFGGGQQQQNTGIFGTQQPQQGGTNLFNNQQPQQQQGTNIFSNQQQGTNIMGNQQQTNIFGGQQQGANNIFGNQQQQQMNMNMMGQQQGGNQIQKVKFQIQEYSRRIDPKNLQSIRIDELNMFRQQKIGNLQPQTKNYIVILMNNMKSLKEVIDTIKKENDELDKKTAQYCKNVQDKLVKYKECLIQNVSQSNLLDEVKQEIELIQTQVNSFLIPLYNAHKQGKHHSFDSPDQFSSKITKRVLQKMTQLNNKIDQIISCHQTQEQDFLSEQDSNTLQVLEQLLNYYENVSAKVLEFTNYYNHVKRSQIQSHKRNTSYEDVMRRIQDKVQAKMKKDFKCYDLIKEIEEVLSKRQKRQQEMALNYDKNAEKRGSLSLGSIY